MSYEHDRRSLDAGATMSVPSGREVVRSPRFLDEGDPCPDAQAVGPYAERRLDAWRAAAGVPASTRWRPRLRQ